MRFILFFIVILSCGVFPSLSYGKRTPAEIRKAAEAIRSKWSKESQFDDAKIAADGIRKLEGKHLTLYTDLPSDPEVDELPKVFDLAVPIWCERFDIPEKYLESWHVTGCLMKDFDRFKPSGLVDTVPDLRHGYSIGYRFWLREQESSYYRRHLVLHEGVHCFMCFSFGKWGPLWYMEGAAELLGTHTWNGTELKLGVMPKNLMDFPIHGRIRLIHEAYAKDGVKPLDSLFELPMEQFQQREAYAWSWAFATFCVYHPDYKDAFWEFSHEFPFADSNDWFIKRLGKEKMAAIEYDWNDFIEHIDYGYDLERNAVLDHSRGKPLTPEGGESDVTSDHGWQNTGILLEAGKSYRFDATGKFRLAREPSDWWSEASGVTIRYYRGQPLGILLGVVIPSDNKPGVMKSFPEPFVIGTEKILNCETSGTLYLRINDNPAELEDNDGTLKVRIGYSTNGKPASR